MQGKATAVITTEDALESVRVIQRAYKSAGEHRWEKVIHD
jgi:predicted dehydrogenase